MPVPLNDRGVSKPPQGCGNAVIVDPANRRRFVGETVDHLRSIEGHFDVSIRRIAIDAPSAPLPDGESLRAAEAALDHEGIDYIQTPTRSQFDEMAAVVRQHLARGGTEATLPRANQLWMLFGFDLFDELTREGWDCLEVYPQATVRALGVGDVHKTKAGAVEAQLTAAAKYTGWPDEPTLAALGRSVTAVPTIALTRTSPHGSRVLMKARGEGSESRQTT